MSFDFPFVRLLFSLFIKRGQDWHLQVLTNPQRYNNSMQCKPYHFCNKRTNYNISILVSSSLVYIWFSKKNITPLFNMVQLNHKKNRQKWYTATTSPIYTEWLDYGQHGRVSCKKHELFTFREHLGSLQILRWVIVLVFCVMFFVLFVFVLCPVHNVANVSGLSFLGYLFDFL